MDENNMRAGCVEKFVQLLNDSDLAGELEGKIYKFVVNYLEDKNMPANWEDKYFRRLYMNKCISIYGNLDPNSYVANKGLLSRFVISPDVEKLVKMTPQELFPENWDVLMKKKLAKDELLYTNKFETYTEQFTCGRCKQNKCTFYQLQTRSADEPMTSFITCQNCGQKWKM